MKEIDGAIGTAANFETEVRAMIKRKRRMIENFIRKCKDDWEDSSLLKAGRYRQVKWDFWTREEKVNFRKYLKFAQTFAYSGIDETGN